ncbi:hypothetical protein ACSSVY_004564 [Roseovarius sp. MBR-51]
MKIKTPAIIDNFDEPSGDFDEVEATPEDDLWLSRLAPDFN